MIVTHNRPPERAPAQTADELDWEAVRHAVFAYVRRKGQPQDIAEDIAQETVAKLLRYLEDHRPASLFALAIRIAENSLIDRFRTDTRYRAELDAGHRSEEPLPDQVASDRQHLRILRQTLDAMPPLRRAVLVRRRIENQSCARIAADLGLTAAAVEKHIVRGLSDLRDALARRSDRQGRD